MIIRKIIINIIIIIIITFLLLYKVVTTDQRMGESDMSVTMKNYIGLQCAAKKVSPKVVCHFLSNCSEFLHEISHIYYSFIIT